MKLKLFAAAGTSALVMAFTTSVQAVPVVVYQEPSIVDVASGPAFSEGLTIAASATSLGHTVSTFVGTSGAAFSAALAGQSVLIMPEPEAGNYSSLSADARTAVANFVSAGGGLITSYSDTDVGGFLNATFGFSLSGSAGCLTSSLTGGAGTAFAGGPATLGCPSFTTSFTLASLPGGSTGIYTAGSNAEVALIPFGAGQIVTLGWDWFNAAPNGSNGAADWVPVLGNAITEVAGTTTPVPEPGTLAIMGLGLAGLGFARRRKAA